MTTERTVLVTGAGGFIGGRMVEALHQVDGIFVRPSLRRWSTAARIGRLPLDPVQCDLLRPEQIRSVLEGVDSVIHCAVGDRRATVEGTRNLVEAALEAGTRRVVHLSTIDVYGRAEGTVDEGTPLERTGRAYGDSKIEAEEACLDAAGRGLEVVILRPTIVYGPFSDLWTLEFAEKFRDRSWSLPRSACQGRCNLVYVDDLVTSAVLALDADGVAGHAFNVNGPDAVTWQDYFDALNEALGYPPLETPTEPASRLRATLIAPVRAAVKGTYKRLEAPILAVYKKSAAARVVMKWVERTLKSVPSSAEFDLYGRDAVVVSREADRLLGYRPRFDMRRGVDMSARWLEHVGAVEPGAD